MHRFGLHGKSFVPMMTGFGCSIPGIMATRTLENDRDRLTTMLVLPLMSCGARLPIWMLLIPAFFAPVWRAPMLFFVYAFGILLAFVLALVLRKSVLRGEEAPFVMELPPYRVPTLRAVATRMAERSWLYVRKAGTVILGISILMWFITAYPEKDTYDVDAALAAGQVTLSGSEIAHARAAEDLEFSVAGRVGKAVEPVIRPLGFDWKMGTAMLGAFAAKEVFVAQMGIVYAMGETDEESQGLRETLAADYSPLVGLSLMLFLLIAAPCMATVAVTRRESGSWKWALLQVGGLTAVAYVISLVVYQVGRLFGG
jgi:ferrous iron transport protein B